MLKRWLVGIGSLLAMAGLNCAAAVEWMTDVNAAMTKARTENKVVLLDFTGSDWCIWCQRLKAEVFDTPEFAAFAEANLILVEVDFPRAKPLPPALKGANEQLARKFNITGYPTLIFINGLGQEVGKGGYLSGGPKNSIAAMEKIPGIRHVNAPAVGMVPREPEAPRRPPPAFVPIPPATPTVYGDLALKGISGAADNRFALINNVTLAAGESAKVKVKDARVEVLCKEIRADSVLLVVDGKPVELKLGQR